jgi:hypothetical protein
LVPRRLRLSLLEKRNDVPAAVVHPRRVGDAACLVFHLAIEAAVCAVEQQSLHDGEGRGRARGELTDELFGGRHEFLGRDDLVDDPPFEGVGRVQNTIREHQFGRAPRADDAPPAARRSKTHRGRSLDQGSADRRFRLRIQPRRYQLL